ncbi:MAG TPA: DUF1054 domain-containing protein [Stenomitos sp.]
MPIAMLPKLEGFTHDDFDVFSLQGFEERMTALKTHVRPKLEALGAALAPELAHLLGTPVFAHVAKHARRTVNPPQDTWVAWSTNARGYKAHPHFQLGLWGSHVFMQFALIYESPLKAPFARRARQELDRVRRAVPEHFRWSDDHMRPGGRIHGELGKEDLHAFLERGERVAKAEILCGVDMTRDEVAALAGADLATCALATFKAALPLYNLATT